MENLVNFINKQLKLIKDYYEVLKELFSYNSNYYCEVRNCKEKIDIYEEILKKIGEEKNEIKNVRN